MRKDQTQFLNSRIRNTTKKVFNIRVYTRYIFSTLVSSFSSPSFRNPKIYRVLLHWYRVVLFMKMLRLICEITMKNCLGKRRKRKKRKIEYFFYFYGICISFFFLSYFLFFLRRFDVRASFFLPAKTFPLTRVYTFHWYSRSLSRFRSCTLSFSFPFILILLNINAWTTRKGFFIISVSWYMRTLYRWYTFSL